MSKTVTALTALARFVRIVLPLPNAGGVDFNAEVDRVLSRLPVRSVSSNWWPSEINSPYSCNRKQAFRRIEKVWTDKTREEPDRLKIMHVGTSVHHWVQDRYFAPTKKMFGHWRCPNCRNIIFTNQTLPNDLCPNHVTIHSPANIDDVEHGINRDENRRCSEIQIGLRARGEPHWLYEELRLFDSDLLISGKVDGIWIEDGWYTIEIKSLDDNGFEEVVAVELSPDKIQNLPKEFHGRKALVKGRFSLPKPYQVNQGSIYSAMLVHQLDALNIGLEAKDYRGTYIVYVNRATFQMKAFFRRNSEAAFEAARNTINTVMMIVGQADHTPREDPVEEAARVESNRAIAMRIGKSCRDRADRKAKQCPWQTVCFPYAKAAKNKVEWLDPVSATETQEEDSHEL